MRMKPWAKASLYKILMLLMTIFDKPKMRNLFIAINSK